MSRLQVIAGGLVVAVLFLAAGFAGYRFSRGDETVAPRNPSTVAVTRGDVSQTVVAPGRAVGTGEVVLGMSIGGRLAEVAVRPGSVVQAGDVVARLDTAPLEAAVEAARLQRDRGAQDDPQLEQQVIDAEEALRVAELRAPFDGVVLTVTAVPGMAVGPFEGFIRLADPRALEVRTTVIEEESPPGPTWPAGGGVFRCGAGRRSARESVAGCTAPRPGRAPPAIPRLHRHRVSTR